ncbi:MAG: 4-hydroxy-3-methylbut-2-enyl diphosphate reductase [Hydrogenophilus sp.]|nr:4-hydroxy-3-methylbut-2-enyl diphosphate reductase [Hydrogenophilus sp.]
MAFTVTLANPRGFCAGVDRALAIVEQALQRFGPPIYVRHEVVHNRRVIETLAARGVRFVESLEQIPPRSILIFSAHGVSPAVRTEAQRRQLTILDATCPLVTKVHREVIRLHATGHTIVMIGHRGHPEVEGTMGQVPDRIWLIESEKEIATLPDLPAPLAYVTQTTLSVDDCARLVAALRRRFPHIVAPPKEDICYATQNRQEAVKRLARDVDLILVIGSPNSSNSNRLREVASAQGIDAYLIDDASSVDPSWLSGRRHIGVTAGASAPETLVQEVVHRLLDLGATHVYQQESPPETVRFTLPMELSR